MKSDFHKGRWGTCFKNGKLYDFDKSSVLVMKGWPDPRAWVKNSRKGWHHDRKKADKFFSAHFFLECGRPPAEPPSPDEIECPHYLNHPDVADEEREQNWEWHRKTVVREWKEKHQMADFFDGIPPDIRYALSSYSTRKWHLFNLLARCPGAYDLHVSNPALCYALASSWVFHKPAVLQPMRAARSLIRKKQKDILRWLGFPATDAVRKILRKIPSSALSVETLLYLRDTVRDPARVKTLCHLPRLNTGALRLVTSNRLAPLLTYRLLEDVALNVADNGEHHTHRILIDTFRMDRRLGGERCPRRFVSLRHLEQVHNNLAEEFNILVRQQELENPNEGRGSRPELPDNFPTPPFAGTASIQPISTPAELLQEGIEMKHCVASYTWDVAEGLEYIYRVLEPVRATMSICARGNTWEPGQLLQAANKPVPKEVKAQLFRELLASRKQRSVPIKPELMPVEQGGVVGAPIVAPGIPYDEQGVAVADMSTEMAEVVNRVRGMFTAA